jgi:hypothetical protein
MAPLVVRVQTLVAESGQWGAQAQLAKPPATAEHGASGVCHDRMLMADGEVGLACIEIGLDDAGFDAIRRRARQQHRDSLPHYAFQARAWSLGQPGEARRARPGSRRAGERWFARR